MKTATRKLTKELKAYSISIITTIKELLKAQSAFQRRAADLPVAFRLYRAGQACRFCCRPHNGRT